MAGKVNVPSHAADTLPCVLYYCYGNLILHPLKVIGLAEPSAPLDSPSNWHGVSIKVCQLSGWVSSSVLSQHCCRIFKWALPLAGFFVVLTCCPLLVGFLVKPLRAGSACQPKSNFEPIQIKTRWILCSLNSHKSNKIQFMQDTLKPTSGGSFILMGCASIWTHWSILTLFYAKQDWMHQSNKYPFQGQVFFGG